MILRMSSRRRSPSEESSFTPSQNILTARIQDVLNPIILTIPQTLTNRSLIPPNYGILTYLIGITSSFGIVQIHVQHQPEEPKVYINSTSRPPENVKPVAILPFDPMEWAVREKEILLSADEDGWLQFWVPDVQLDSNERGRRRQQTRKNSVWRYTGSVNSRRKGLIKARCSSTKKTVLGTSSGFYNALPLKRRPVVRTSNGDEVSIWHSKESEFSSGLEWSRTFESVRQVSWKVF
jgi:hypothetical protein